MAAKIIENFIKMALFKKGGAIATDKAVQFSANALEKRLINLGIDPRTLNNQTELKQVLAYVKQMEDAAFDQKFSGIMKNQNLFKKEGDVIPFKQKRSFAEEIDAMKKSGDLVDEDNMVISEKITDREMFKNSNLNKPTIEGQMEKITGASNKIKGIQKEIDEMYRPKTDAEIKAKYDKQNKESIQKFKDKMKKDEPEDKADGGRIGFRAGKFVLDKIIAKLLGDPKKVKKAADDIFPTGDYKYDAQMAAEALVENNPRIFKNKLYDDLDLDTQLEIYGAVLEPIQKNMSMAIKMKKASRPEKTLAAMKEGKGIDMSDPAIADEFARFMKETDPQGSKTIEQTVELANFDPKKVKGNAEGGRIGYYTGGITDVEPRLDDIGHGADSLMSRTRLMSPGAQATTSTGLNYLLAEDNDNLRIPFKDGLKVYPKIEASKSNQGLGDDKNVDLQDLTYGGTLMYDKGPFSAGIEYLKGKDKFDFKNIDDTLVKDTTDRELANLILMMKLKNGLIKVKGNKDNQMINFSKSFAEGGRIGFSAGGGGRRAFLKFLASIGGLTAAAKSGMIGLGEGTTKKAISETVKQSAGGTYPPPYFFKLVEKIKFMGDDVTEKAATQEREIVKRYKDYEMTEDIGTGNIVIKKRNEGSFYDQDGIVSDEYIVYKPGQADELTKGKKPPAEYEEYTVRPDAEGKLRDSEDGLDSIDEILEEVGDADSLTLKKADGGRIGFRTGGSGKKFIEKIFGKGSLDVMKARDPELHKGMLEVVEMFRNRDKEGLKMYLQKFLPHMDDETIEAFIVGDAADAAGQGKYGLDNIQGQLIRLGSGRDYAGKIKMVKDAENMKALDKLDVTDRKPNASGGLQTMLGE